MITTCNFIQQCMVINLNSGMSSEVKKNIDVSLQEFAKYKTVLKGVIIDISHLDLLDYFLIEEIYSLYRTYELLSAQVVICGCDTADIITFVNHDLTNVDKFVFAKDVN